MSDQCVKDLSLTSKVNVRGGAIATTLIRAMIARDAQFGKQSRAAHRCARIAPT